MTFIPPRKVGHIDVKQSSKGKGVEFEDWEKWQCWLEPQEEDDGGGPSQGVRIIELVWHAPADKRELER